MSATATMFSMRSISPALFEGRRSDELLARIDDALKAVAVLAAARREPSAPAPAPDRSQPTARPLLQVVAPAEITLRLEEASEILSVSSSTLRRWADDGRIAMQRTEGGHRRFKMCDVEQLRIALHGAGVETRLIGAPLIPAPVAAQLVAARGDSMANVAARAVYQGSRQGWFAGEAAVSHLGEWTGLVREALAEGDYGCARRATDRLMQRAERANTTLVERHLFLERFCEVLARSLSERQAGPAAVGDVRRLFAHLAHRHLAAQSRVEGPAPAPFKVVA